MNIRKHWMKFVLSASAFFWAGCSDDSASAKGAEHIDIGDCESDDIVCGGGMIALYGVGPIYDISSSSVTSSDSCEQGCDEMISSSSAVDANSSATEAGSSSAMQENSSSSVVEPNKGSEIAESSNSVDDKLWVSGRPSEEIDLNSVRARGDSSCAEHGGLRIARQYEPDWGAASASANDIAREEVRDSVEKYLKSSKATSLPAAKKSCLEQFANSQMIVCMYGTPLVENSYDIWEYTCNDGQPIKDDAYLQKDKEYAEEYKAAKEEYLEKYHKEVADCDNATDSSSSSDISGETN